MKKFVSLVLVLALALSLCTVAMAASSYSDFKTKGPTSWEAVSLTGASVSFTAPSETKVDGEVTNGRLGYYTVTGDGFGVNGCVYIECDKADANNQMKVDGKVVYLVWVEGGVDDITYTAVGTKATVGSKCGNYNEDVYGEDGRDADVIEVTVDDEVTVYYTDDDGTVNILVGKEVVSCTLDAAPDKVGHDWNSFDSKIVIEDGEVKSASGTVVCKVCGQKATITDDFSKVPDNAEWVETEDGVYVYWVDAAAAGTTSTTVDSSKTFDAGVAMYVGLSLMSVAGSAVVIGKKKEF